MNLILKAARIAHEGHKDVFRDYTNRPFIEHPMRVAGWTSMISNPHEEYTAAAYLHDTPEDNPDFWAQVKGSLPESVRIIAEQLRNPSKDRPELPRADRKKMDREHIAGCGDIAKIIKMIDRADNLGEMDLAKAGFKRKYAAESLLLVETVRPTINNVDFTYWAGIVEKLAYRMVA